MARTFRTVSSSSVISSLVNRYCQKMLFGFIILCLTSVQWTRAQKLHEQMSADQVAEIFHTTDNSVPDYEVLQFHSPRISKRESKEPENRIAALRKPQRLVTKAFGEEIELWLRPAEGVLAGQSTPVFRAWRDAFGDVKYKQLPDAMKRVGKLLEDPELKTSLIATKDARGRYSFNGFIGSMNMVVRSLPESISDDLVENNSSTKSESAYHVVFKAEERNFNETIDKSFKHIDLRTSNPSALSRNFSLPDVIYPEIMVVVDYNLFGTHQYNVDKVLMYLLAFWNGVDLLYRSFEQPKFRFNIARVIIATEDRSTPYLAYNMFDAKLLDAYKAHEDAGRYFFSILNIFPSVSYDAAIIMTSLQMTSGSGNNDVLGIATTSGACYINYRDKSVAKLGLVNDDGTFQGILTAAHEFAHLLGARHDESDDCQSHEGFIMAPSSGVTDNGHDFSNCTVKAIERFLSLNGGYCFYNKPSVSEPLSRRLLPGLLSDRDHQCKMLNHGKSCYKQLPWQLPCTAIYCLDIKNPTYCYQYRSDGPPDGAFCGEGKVCLHGKCLKL